MPLFDEIAFMPIFTTVRGLLRRFAVLAATLGLCATTAVAIDGKQQLLRKGQRSPEGMLLVSAHAGGAVLEIEGAQKNYPLGRQISTKFRKADKSAPLRIWPTSNGM